MDAVGGDKVAQSLKEAGVTTIFGIPGGAALPMFDALFESGIQMVLMRHEQAAAHAADGYARRTGLPGIVMATSGPGATNLITGMATAHSDSVPMVAIVAQVATAAVGTDAFQEADMLSMSASACKHSIRVQDASDVAGAIKEAIAVSLSGRPGPVLLELPKDVQASASDRSRRRVLHVQSVPEPDLAAIRRAAALLAAAQRPALYVGGGAIISGAGAFVRQVAERLNAPVATTLMGLGAISSEDPHHVGMLGMHGTVTANWAVDRCDVLLAVGTRFDDRVTGAKPQLFAKVAKVIHIDIDPAEIGKVRRVDVPICADAATALSALLHELPKREHPSWWETLQSWQIEHPLRYQAIGKGVPVPDVLARLYALTRGKAVLTTEVGQHQMWAAQYCKILEPRRWLTSGGLGTMGYGFPAAIGAAVADNTLPVIALCGDGSFQMNVQELATLSVMNLPVKIIVFDNSGHGMVRQWQRLFYAGRYVADHLENPDFAKVAEAYGVKGLRLDDSADIDDVLQAMLAHDGPVLVDCTVPYGENVYPMIPAGGTVADLVEAEPIG